MSDLTNERPVLIKKVKKGGGHGHHGGAWKVAYADFVTAMMAFFLLLWLLATTTEEQRAGIADYFAPTSVSERTTSGSGGILGGQTLTVDGAMRGERTPFGVVIGIPEQVQAEVVDETEPAREEEAENGEPSQEAAAEALREQEDEEFQAAVQGLMQAIESVPDLSELSKNLIVDQTPEGMRIQLVDQHGTSMFPSGSAGMYDHTKRLLGLVANAIDQMPNLVAVKGHTDATPYRGNGDYGNWELSSDRANASRRALLAAGLPEARIAYVVGKAATEPLDPADPRAAQNRRISVILLRRDPASAEGDATASDEPQRPFVAPSILRQGESS